MKRSTGKRDRGRPEAKSARPAGASPARFVRWKRAAQNAGLAAAALVVLLAGMEVFLRTAFDGKYGNRPAFFIPDPLLGWRCNAGLDDNFFAADFQSHVKTDEHGYRLGRLGPVDFRKRLVVLSGDSNVFGWGVSTNETAASYLDGLVHDASGGEARVVNLGVGGYGTLQSFYRLREFVETHPGAEIAAVVVVHAPNDAVDNVNSIGYHVGQWKVQDRPPPKRSGLHVVNLVAYASEIVKQRRVSAGRLSKEPAVTHPYLQDMLHAFETVMPKTITPEVVVGGRAISLVNLGEEDWSIERTLAREGMTEVQRELLAAAVGSFHDLPAARGTAVLHVAVPTAPEWFVEELSGIVREAAPDGDGRIGFYGRLLDADQYTGKVLNDHTGGHYTPEFNAVWAERIMGLLRDRAVVRRTRASNRHASPRNSSNPSVSCYLKGRRTPQRASVSRTSRPQLLVASPRKLSKEACSRPTPRSLPVLPKRLLWRAACDRRRHRARVECLRFRQL